MPQNQKTDSFEVGELPQLTDNQAAFVREYLSKGSAIEAYRIAYPDQNMGINSLYVEASRSLHHPKISLWIAAARMAHMGNAVCSRDEHMRELERLREIALKTGNVGAAVNAEVSRGKAAGHYVEKYEDVSRSDPLAALQELAKIAPDAAKALAQEHGIQLESVH